MADTQQTDSCYYRGYVIARLKRTRRWTVSTRVRYRASKTFVTLQAGRAFVDSVISSKGSSK